MRAATSLSLLAFAATALAAPVPPKVQAPSAVLMDAGTGTVLWSRGAATVRPMASTTKMMTALLVAESGKLDETVTVSAHAAKTPESSLNLRAGERITLRNLLYGIVLRSGNDACVAAAEALDGSVPAFVKRMNARATELGCRDTVFVNPNGLHAAGHRSSARDLALIGRAVLANPTVAEVVRTPVYTIERSKSTDRALVSRFRRFLVHYPGADGIKTGYTKQAGRCFVGSASRNGLHLVSVVLKSPNVLLDTTTLLNYGFANYRGGAAAKVGQPVGFAKVERGVMTIVPVTTPARADYVIGRGAEPVRIVMPRVPAKAPIRAGDPVGTARLVSGGRLLATFPVVAAAQVPLSPAWRALQFGSYAVGVLLVGGLVGALAENTRRRRRRIAARRRGPDSRRTGDGKRPDSDARRSSRDGVGPHSR